MLGSLISKAATLICRREMTLFNLECNNVKRKCCLYYLTLKIMSKPHILIKLKPKELHKPFLFDFFLQNSYQGKRENIRDTNDDDNDNDFII